MTNQKKKSLHFEHHLLIAMPSLRDPNFSHSVVYIFEHSAQGALGMIINKPMQIELNSVMNHLGITKVDEAVAHLPVYSGGPVGQEQGFILHEVNHQVEISASKEMLEAIAEKKGPEPFLVVLGYSGWGANQLEEEISRNDWLLTPADKKIVFDLPAHERWQKAAELIGVDIHKLSGHSGHA